MNAHRPKVERCRFDHPEGSRYDRVHWIVRCPAWASVPESGAVYFTWAEAMHAAEVHAIEERVKSMAEVPC